MPNQKKLNKIILILIFIAAHINLINSSPFLGGFYYTNNYFENSKFTTMHTTSFYIENNIKEKIKFYTRLTAGFKFYTDIFKYEYVDAYNVTIKNFTVIPNIDLLFFEFNSNRKDHGAYIENKDEVNKIVNYNTFAIRFGRIPVTHQIGFLYSMRGDGLDTNFMIKNFKFRFFAVSNSLDFLPFFDFMEGYSKPVFTRWDTKRYPVLSNYQKENNTNGFISDITSPDYNFYFDNDYESDYTQLEKNKLNSYRYGAILAGRIFSGVSFEFLQIAKQNFSIGFLVNLDLIPKEFILVHPSETSWVDNTFAGRYTSFYFSFNANGKIVRNFYYNFEGVYQTGFNTGYTDTGTKIILEDKSIQTFAFDIKFSYYFNHKTKPSLHLGFIYAQGDENGENIDDAIIVRNTKYKYDHTFRSPGGGPGFVFESKLSNTIVIFLSHTIKPFGFVKNEVFTRILMGIDVLLFLRPIVEGFTFIPEKSIYLKGGSNHSSPEKAFIGVEFDMYFLWAVFSDFKLEFKSGIFVPNGRIHRNTDNPELDNFTPNWKVGLAMNLSF